ncbi:MAG: hypothetical protein R3348_02450 [Xanthomonadales bacterium]|nr:hypothetical protein [Xanthomonadales bacterium]
MNMRAISISLAGVWLGGCAATTTIDEYRPSTEPLDYSATDKVVILGRRDAGHYETDRDFVGCIGKEMRGSDITVLPEQEFIDALYPWFEPRTAPKGLPRLKRLMEESYIRDEVSRENVRYVVWLDGTTETQGHMGSMSCSMGPAGAGCFGYSQWEKVVFIEAIIWDLRDLTEKGRIRVDSEGTSYLIGVVAPIPLLSPVKNDACKGLGEQLLTFFEDNPS